MGASESTESAMSGLEESKAAKRLTKKVESMISKLDDSVVKLSAEKSPEEAPVAPPEVADVAEAAKAVPTLEATKLIEKQ